MTMRQPAGGEAAAVASSMVCGFGIYELWLLGIVGYGLQNSVSS